MSNFRTRILGLAAVATAFVGAAYGQAVVCGAPTPAVAPGNPTLRAEGETELVGDLAVSCTNSVATATTGTVFMTTSLPITSRAVTGISPANSEATITLTQTGAGALGPFTVQGAVSGAQVSFVLPALAIPPSTQGGGVFTLLVQNIRVNASGGGAPQVTESGVISYATGGTSANAGIASLNVGFILSTLGTTTLVSPAAAPFPGISSYTVCGGNAVSALAPNPNAAISFVVNIKELVGGAFKSAGAAPAGEGGSFVGAAPIGAASTATQVSITYANVPAAATIWVPVSETNLTSAGNSTTLTIAGATPPTSGPFSAAFAPAGLPAGVTYGAWVSATPSSGSVTVTYTTSILGTGAVGTQTFAIPTVVAFAANAAGAQTAITALVSYAPTGTVTGPAAAVPTFLAATSPAASGSTITLCQTSMLFPFVTNQLGFDTGIVMANTSTDNLGTVPGKPSSVAAQSGTCLLSFFGAGAPTPSVGVADPQGSTASGTTHAFLLSAVAPGFQGYMIATCPFQFAHGFGFLAYNLTQNNGAVEGYIAEVLARGSSAPEAQTF